MPFLNKRTIQRFILRQCAPGWFRFRYYSCISDRARNSFFLVQCATKLYDANKRRLHKRCYKGTASRRMERTYWWLCWPTGGRKCVRWLWHCRQQPSGYLRQFRRAQINSVLRTTLSFVSQMFWLKAKASWLKTLVSDHGTLRRAV